MSMDVDELNALVGLQYEQIEGLGDELAESQEKIKNLEGNLRVAFDNEEILSAELGETEAELKNCRTELQERREQSDRLRSYWIHMRRERDSALVLVERLRQRLEDTASIIGLDDETDRLNAEVLAEAPTTSLGRLRDGWQEEQVMFAHNQARRVRNLSDPDDIFLAVPLNILTQAEVDVSDEAIEKENDMGEAPRVTGSKTVYVAWQNTDLTEGRGGLVPLAVCETHATAVRLGAGKNVQGSNCSVTEEIAVKVEGYPRSWLAPSQIIKPSAGDQEREKKRLDRAEAQERKRIAIERAKEAGLTDEDIKALEADL